jgi:hypothetical protein
MKVLQKLKSETWNYVIDFMDILHVKWYILNGEAYDKLSSNENLYEMYAFVEFSHSNIMGTLKDFFYISMCVCWWGNCSSCDHSYLCTCVPVTVLYSSWFKSVSVLIIDITLPRRIMHICQYVCFVCVSMLQLSPPFILLFVSPLFSVSFLPKSPGIPFDFVWQYHNHLWPLYVNL